MAAQMDPQTFKVLQWNILAEGLDGPEDFPQSPPESLIYSTRFDRIMDVINLHAPDILCVQELNYPGNFAMQLTTLAMIHCAKLDSPCLPHHPPDGCGLFVSRDRFDILDVTTHYYASAASPDADTWDSPLANQCAILAKLRDKRSGKTALVATTHLKAKAGEVERAARLSQTRQLLALVSAKAMHAGERIPVILCGDFNSDPNKESVVYDEIYAHPLAFSSAYNAHTQREQTGGAVHFDNPGGPPDQLPLPPSNPNPDPNQTTPPPDAAAANAGAATTAASDSADPDSAEITPRARHDSKSTGKGGALARPQQTVAEYKLGEPAYTTWKFRGSKASSEKKECIDFIWATLGPLEGSCQAGDMGWAHMLDWTQVMGMGGAPKAAADTRLALRAVANPNPNPNRLALRAVVPLRGPGSTGLRGLPSNTFPSDHLFLCCEFALL